MIVVEKQLDAAFNTIPLVGGKKVIYKWGNEAHLRQLLVAYQKGNDVPYPLIYQVSNASQQQPRIGKVESRLSFVIATRNTETAQLNENRWAMTYNDILYPIAEYMETLFSQGNIFVAWDKEYTLTTFPNYSAGERSDANATIDIWDALRFDTTLTINDNCINDIIY